jgi:hypothetical protein
MSTFLVGGVVGASLETVYAQTGGALQSTGAVELQINQATTVVNDSGVTRQISRNEVLILLNIFTQYVERMNWPFAAS